MTKQERDEARARCKAATPGPWLVTDSGCGRVIADIAPEMSSGGRFVVMTARDVLLSSQNGMSDATFIARARTDLPAALAEIDWLEAEIAEMKKFFPDSWKRD